MLNLVLVPFNFFGLLSTNFQKHSFVSFKQFRKCWEKSTLDNA